MNLASAFGKAAAAMGGNTAIFWEDRQYGYGEIWDQTERLAQWLRQEWKLQPGDRVALWLKNCPEFVPALFGILRAGGVVVPVNNFLKPDEVRFILSDAAVLGVVTEAELAGNLPEPNGSEGPWRCWGVEGFRNLAPAEDRHWPEPRAHDLAVLIYTSGTTGKPKGAMLSHGNLLGNVESCRRVLTADKGDRFVVLLPMFHSFMLTVCILLPMLIGGSMVIIRSVQPPKSIIQEILARKATILPAIPQFFRALAHAQLPPGSPLRACISGGAPLPVEILREFNARMPIPLVEGYGLSEASPVVSINPLEGPQKPGSVGRPVPNVEITVQDELGQILPTGETGEICVRGPNVMLGYWKQPEETAKTLRNGWLLTGDIGYGDEEGFYYITDRKKDMLLVNGINVYPREIEETIYRFPHVKEAAVIGIADSRKGEQPMAFVVPEDGRTLNESALQDFLKEKLADYKVPRRVAIVPGLPRNATGKILKTVLREQARQTSAVSGGETQA